LSDMEKQKQVQESPNESGAEEFEELPLVIPSPITYKVLGNMLTDIDNDNKENRPHFSPEIIHTHEFKTLAAWFNGLFLFPTLIFQHMGFLDVPSEEIVMSNDPVVARKTHYDSSQLNEHDEVSDEDLSLF